MANTINVYYYFNTMAMSTINNEMSINAMCGNTSYY